MSTRKRKRIPPKYPNSGKPWLGRAVMEPRPEPSDEELERRRAQSIYAQSKPRREMRVGRNAARWFNERSTAQRMNLAGNL